MIVIELGIRCVNVSSLLIFWCLPENTSAFILVLVQIFWPLLLVFPYLTIVPQASCMFIDGIDTAYCYSTSISMLCAFNSSQIQTY